MIKNKVSTGILTLLLLLASVSPLHAKRISAEQIFAAAEKGSAYELEELFKTDINCAALRRGEDSETVLMAALKADRSPRIIKLIVTRGVNEETDVGRKTKSGKTALMYAARYSSVENTEYILNIYAPFFKFLKRWRILKKDKSGMSALSYAHRYNPEVEQYLLQYFPENYAEKHPTKITGTQKESEETEEIDTPSAEETAESIMPISTPADVVTAESSALTVAETIMSGAEDGAASSEETTSSDSESSSADSNDYVSVISKDEPVPEINPFKKTYLLDYAELAEDDDYIIPDTDDDDIEYTLTYIEDFDKPDIHGRTPLMKAARNARLKLMKDLINLGADINAVDDDGWTALMFAARFSGSVQAVEILLDAGADWSLKNNYGITALRLAAGFSAEPSITGLLLSKYTPAEKEVRAAFIFAIISNAPVPIIKEFTDADVYINSPYDGKTPLMYAAESNKNTDIIAWLIKLGAKNTYITDSGMTAFDFASKNESLPHDDIYWSLKTER